MCPCSRTSPARARCLTYLDVAQSTPRAPMVTQHSTHVAVQAGRAIPFATSILDDAAPAFDELNFGQRERGVPDANDLRETPPREFDESPHRRLLKRLLHQK